MSKLTICAPLRIEARALRRGLDGHGVQAGDVTQPAVHIDVARIGYGPIRAAAAGRRIAQAEPDMVAVGGTTASCPSAPLLAGELRRTGLTALVRQILTVDRLVKPGGHAALAKTGALAVDMETAPLLAGVGNRPAIVIRAISDTPEQ